MGKKERLTPAVLKALGRKTFPRVLHLPGGAYELARPFKHDFFAATALYKRNDGHAVVLKIGRSADVLGVPAGWIGRCLARREARMYQALADVENVPAFVAMYGDCGFVHEYVEGHELRRDEPVADEFFDELATLIATIHARGMAYVDLEKCENIIVSDEGKPFLIDFQISWDLPARWCRHIPPLPWLMRELQRMDRYHLLKHRRRTRPNQLDPDRQASSADIPTVIRLHRALVKPLQLLRRGFLRRVDPEYSPRGD